MMRSGHDRSGSVTSSTRHPHEVGRCHQDGVERVSQLRDPPGGDVYIYGSLSVARALLTEGLIDELVLMIEPITLGGGKTVFPNDGEARNSSSSQRRLRRPVCRSVATGRRR